MNRVVFVFPGQGSQYVGMGRDLAQNFREARMVFEEASDSAHLDLLRLCAEGPEEELNRTEMTQPALLTVSMAALRVLISETGIRPQWVAGHSLGEYSAVTAGEGMCLSDAAGLVRQRGRFMQEAVPEGEGGMAAILGLDADRVRELCDTVEGQVVPANLNCPGQVVISGEKCAVEEAMERAREAGAKRTVLLPVSVPSHSPLMESAARRLREVLEKTPIRDLAVPLVNNVDARPVRSSEEVLDGLVRQLTAPLRWEEGIRAMLEDGMDTVIEIGPGRVLSGLIRRIDRKMTLLNIENTDSFKKLLKTPICREVESC